MINGFSAIKKQIAEQIRAKAKPHRVPGAERFGISIRGYSGLTNGEAYAIADSHFAIIKKLDADGITDCAQELLDTDSKEARYIAYRWVSRSIKKFEPRHLKVFEQWLREYTFDWADCDFLCTKIIGEFFVLHPDKIPVVFKWAKLKDEFMRRGAAVSLIVPVKRLGTLAECLAVADSLIADKRDLVQKGMGWLLKVAAEFHRSEVVDYLRDNSAIMTRTAFRYAIEKMPDKLRKELLSL